MHAPEVMSTFATWVRHASLLHNTHGQRLGTWKPQAQPLDPSTCESNGTTCNIKYLASMIVWTPLAMFEVESSDGASERQVPLDEQASVPFSVR